jgi:hypothetical protein
MRPRRIARSRHVARDVISSARQRSPHDELHLASCPACFGAVRRAVSFERQLGAASRALATQPIPEEVLTMPMPSIRRPSMPSPMSLGVIAVLAVAGGLVAWTVIPPSHEAANIGAAPSAPRPTAALDPHTVTVDGVTWRIGVAGDTIEIHRTASSGTSSAVPRDLIAVAAIPPGLDPETSSISFGSMLHCPRPGGADQWVVFGWLSPRPGYPPAAGPVFDYSGPPAHGQDAPDGLFLYVIDPATFDAKEAVKVQAPGGRKTIGFGGLVAYDTDVRQPSGCFVGG